MRIIPSPEKMPADPVEIFLDWYQEAIDRSIPDQVRNDNRIRMTDLFLLKV